MDKALIVFIKNPELGKAKTRLAATVGKERALEIYQLLLDYTRKVSTAVEAEKFLYYSSFLENDDWPTSFFNKKLQQGTDLGERMSHALSAAFAAGAKKAVIIGSDCAELTTEIIEAAFEKLEEAPLVFGPARDGGYYLVGMTELFPFVFENKPWSQAALLNLTLAEITDNGFGYRLLPLLSDVDTEEDWKRVGFENKRKLP